MIYQNDILADQIDLQELCCEFVYMNNIFKSIEGRHAIGFQNRFISDLYDLII